MAAIDYARFALILRRCAEIAADNTATEQVGQAYTHHLKASAERFLATQDAASSAEREFELSNAPLVESVATLEHAYIAARAVVKQHLPDAGLPDSLLGLPSLFDRVIALETLLNILDDSIIEETWAAKEMMGLFGVKAPPVIRELGEAMLASSPLSHAGDIRATAYGQAFERHLVFKRIVRHVFGPHSGQYQSIHWRVDWGKEGAGPVSWGPYSFRAPFRTW